MNRYSRLLAAVFFALGGCTNTLEGGTGLPGHAGAAAGQSGQVTGGQAMGGQAGTSAGQGGASVGGAAGTGAPPPLVLDAGHVVLRRLNRSEYNNTVRDLLGTSLRPADRLPEDTTVDGFDTVGEGLFLTLQHLELLEQGATELIDELFALPVADSRRASVLVCEPEATSDTCARQILTGFARRAFRRPVVDSEITSLLALIENARTAGNGYQDAVKAGLRAILLSPHFLFMVERSSTPGANVASPVNDHELATRLSYFIWSSMPDPELSAQADAGTLTRDGTALGMAAARMLLDSKAAAMTENFSGQWLTLRRLALVEPSPRTFPSYDVGLRNAAVEETERFLSSLVQENAALETLLTADFTLVNQDLGQHYGIPVTGSEFQRVSLATTARAGLLGQTSFLMATSHPSQTSPSKRGAWVLEQLLCSPPAPPPPDVNTTDFVTDPGPDGQTLRQRLEQHRADDRCAGCHAELDPIGFGLENFDAIGAYRTTENGLPVDATGTLEAVPFSGARELAALLANDPRFAICVTQQLLTYAVGRSFHTEQAKIYAEALVSNARAEGRRGFRDLIDSVVQSEAFRTRRGE